VAKAAAAGANSPGPPPLRGGLIISSYPRSGEVAQAGGVMGSHQSCAYDPSARYCGHLTLVKTRGGKEECLTRVTEKGLPSS